MYLGLGKISLVSPHSPQKGALSTLSHCHNNTYMETMAPLKWIRKKIPTSRINPRPKPKCLKRLTKSAKNTRNKKNMD
jgi:hypothetical protein